MNKKVLIIAAIGLYLLTSGLSYMFFAGRAPGAGTAPTSTAKPTNDYDGLEFAGPQTEECPLNGAKYSKDQRKWWEAHRPLGVMIENHQEARPQSGLSFADVVYETVAEGGITRFLAVYYCQDGGIVGPIRSARTYFLDWISEYGTFPLYAHVGGANTAGPADALGQIVDYGWNVYNDLNQFSIGFPTYRRDESRLDHPVATEHTMYSTTSRLWKVGEQRGLTEVDEEGSNWDEDFVSYKFKNDAKEGDRGDVGKINIEFWSNQPQYNVIWTYDAGNNTYVRTNGGQPHIDNNTDKQLRAKNVVVLYMRESNANDGYPGNVHLLYRTTGSGEALIFQDGKELEGTWKKADREGRTIITVGGKEVEFNRGLIWFEVVSLESDVTAN